ncbi:MAG: hypothetical protein ACRCVT_04200 [Leadbetterella sp.]
MNSVRLTLLLSMMGFASISQKPEKILGKWKMDEESKSVVEIFLAKDGMYYGKVVSSNDPKLKEGYLLFRKCKYDSASESLKGDIRLPDPNFDMNLTLSLVNSGKLKATVKKLLMSKTLLFSKIN